MRRSHLLGVALIAALLMSACSDSDGGQCRSVYCDDSGCYACDPDSCYCWEIDNSPCDQGCANDEYCTPEGICAAMCEFDGDCAEGESCLPEGYCAPRQEPNHECDDDNDCGTGLICELDGDGIMTCQSGCREDDECGDGYVCNPECHRCVPEDDPACGDTKTYCDTSEQCGTDRVCSASGKCIYTCQDTEDCPYSQVCDAQNQCEPDTSGNHADACLFSSDCNALSMCQDSGCLCVNTYCRALCDSREDCGDMEICDMGVCVANYRPEN
jgi:hypothetical protein